MKQAIKTGSSAFIRGLSFLLPKVVLFRLFCGVRRFHIWLTERHAPVPLLKGIDHIFYSLRPALITTQIDGATFLVRLNDPCHYNPVIGVHEPPVVAWLKENVRPGMNAIDLGANIGSYTVLLANLVGPEGRVLSVEADTGVVQILRHNVEANRLAHVDVVNGAAHSSCGTLRLGRAAASSWYTGAYYRQASEWVDVPACTVDSLVADRQWVRVDLVKIDVEGNETAVLQGMNWVLRNFRPIVFVELHDYNDEGSAHPALDVLRDAGYDFSYLSPQHVISRRRAT